MLRYVFKSAYEIYLKKIVIGGSRISFVVKLMCKYCINIVKPTDHILLIPPIYCKPTATCFIFNDLFHELLEINWFAMTFFLRPGFNHIRFDITLILQNLSKTYMERNIRDEEGFKILINISKLVYCV